MSDVQPERRRRMRRSSPLRRLWRTLAASRVATTLVVLALAVSGVAIAVALASSQGVAPPIGSPSPVAIATASPAPTASLPAIPTPTASANASASVPPVPVGVVARRIRIERLGIDLRIIEGDGIEAPLDRAVHYPGTSWPGGGSNIYIYAHAQKGMFLSLWDAKVGDTIELDLVDGGVARYAITKVVPKVPWNALEYTEPTPTERLTLQTSTSYTPTAPRFIVIAEPAP